MAEEQFLRSKSAGEDSQKRKLEYPPLPEPLEVGTYDNHCHLEFAFNDAEPPMSWQENLDLATSVGMLGVVQVGVTLESSKWSAELAAREPRVLAAVALHPNEAPLYSSVHDLDAAIAEIAELAKQPRVRAIGETGLDFYRTEGEENVFLQQHSFEEHIRFAKENDIAVMIHDREAHDDVLRVLEEEGAPERVVFHCYSGDAAMAQVCAARGYVLSFAGTLTFKNAPQLREALAVIPADQFLVETDAPFLTPVPYRGKPNAPYLIPHTVRLMAEIRGVSEEEIARVTSATAERLFGPF